LPQSTHLYSVFIGSSVEHISAFHTNDSIISEKPEMNTVCTGLYRLCVSPLTESLYI